MTSWSSNSLSPVSFSTVCRHNFHNTDPSYVLLTTPPPPLQTTTPTPSSLCSLPCGAPGCHLRGGVLPGYTSSDYAVPGHHVVWFLRSVSWLILLTGAHLCHGLASLAFRVSGLSQWTQGKVSWTWCPFLVLFSFVRVENLLLPPRDARLHAIVFVMAEINCPWT